MIPPAQAAARVAAACLLGAALGLYYGFLRPLRLRVAAFGDLLFVAGVFVAWVYLGFAICGGDLRLGYTASLFCGALIWEASAGKWLRPVFSALWTGIFRGCGLIVLPIKFFFEKNMVFCENFICILEKMGYNKME